MVLLAWVPRAEILKRICLYHIASDVHLLFSPMHAGLPPCLRLTKDCQVQCPCNNREVVPKSQNLHPHSNYSRNEALQNFVFFCSISISCKAITEANQS